MKIIRLNEVPDEERDGYSIKRLFTQVLSKRPENVGFYQTTIPTGSRVKSHAHKNLEEILYFLTKTKVKVNEEIYEFLPGDSLILSPNEKHEIIADREKVRLIAIKLPNIPTDRVEG